MRRITITLLTLLAVASISILVVYAQSPHYLRLSGSGPNSDGDLSACFKIAGLGSAAETADVFVTANATAVYACKNHGDQCPNAANKQDVSAEVSNSGTFPIRSGQVTGCLTLEPPSTTLNCPGNQTEVLVSVTYTNVTIHSAAGNATVGSGTFSTNNFPSCP